MFHTPLNHVNTFEPSYAVTNARGGYKIPKSDVRVAVDVNNLFDKNYALNRSYVAFADYNTANFARPESGACRWPSTSKIAIVEMKHLLPALLLAGLGGHAVGLSEVPPADPPRLFLLGTAGGPIPRQERSQPANALVIGGQVYLIDAGDGLLRQMAAKRLNLGAVRALFLTHHHIDHIADVPVLMIDRWLLSSAAPLEVYGPPGSARLVSGTLRAFHPVEL